MKANVNAFVKNCQDLAFFHGVKETLPEDDPVVVAESPLCLQKRNRCGNRINGTSGIHRMAHRHHFRRAVGYRVSEALPNALALRQELRN